MLHIQTGDVIELRKSTAGRPIIATVIDPRPYSATHISVSTPEEKWLMADTAWICANLTANIQWSRHLTKEINIRGMYLSYTMEFDAIEDLFCGEVDWGEEPEKSVYQMLEIARDEGMISKERFNDLWIWFAFYGLMGYGARDSVFNLQPAKDNEDPVAYRQRAFHYCLERGWIDKLPQGI